ncbi:MAG TPA: ABC transporter substrate-binding protein [Candidatus Bathyarchaeia archaeon]|nr:ABC transporter substrate-binding protein [Candidatus Bathyarchaeia archaeon]
MSTDPTLSRRDVLKLTAVGGAAAAMIAPSLARAQAPRRGGVLTVRVWDPPHFDPYLIVAFKTQIVYSFTHSRLLRHKAGPGVPPGSFVLEGDLAESWSQPDDTTYVFKLRKGVRWQPRPPVNGRELTADDVVWSFERFRTVKGNPQSYLLAMVDRVEAVDRYTVKVTLTEPYAWFPDIVANPMTGAIVARECVEKFGDLKKWEATVGTGPWMLDSYHPNAGMTLSRHPHYFVPGLPYADRVELVVDEDTASRTAAFLGGKYDIGPEFMGVINRSDWSQLRAALDRQRPGLKTVEFPSNVRVGIVLRCDRPPFSDVRVRRAVSMALNRRDLVEAVADGAGVLNPPGLPAALREWALPLDQLGDGATAYKYDPAGSRRLLGEAGYPRGFQTVVDFHSFGDTTLVDGVQLAIKYLKDVGIDAKLNQKEYGAYVATSVLGKYEGMIYGPSTPFLEPDSYLATAYLPESLRNISKVNDPALTDLIFRQRRVRDVAKRREIIHDIERHLGKQVYRAEAYSISALGVWDPALKNYAPNLGYDYGGRLVAAWLDR